MRLAEHVPFLNPHDGAFLLLYLIFAVLLLIVALYALKASDRTDVSLLPPVPSEPDPMEMAYLAGGENNVIRTVLYDLRQRGFIEVSADLRIRPARKSAGPGSAGPDKLMTVEQHILEAARSAPTATKLFQNAVLRSAVRDACIFLRARLDAQQLLLPQSVTRTAKRISWIGLSALISPALAATLLDGFQGRAGLGFLWVLAVIAIGCLLAMVRRATSSIASRRGRAFLARVRHAYSDLKTRATAARSAGTFEGAWLFLIGLYGFELLQGTPDGHVAKAFEHGSDGSAAACGAGACSSGSCSGGSCGGGGCGGGS